VSKLTRREALEKAAYVSPLILTFAAMPSFASAGSGDKADKDKDKDKDK
jgi:hypothetical protein